MTINQLKYVVTVAESGSITQAAEKLFISQPNLSMSIKKLEKEIGHEIFMRSGSGAIPTYFGKRFIMEARGVLEQANSLDRLCRNTAVQVPLTLSIATEGFKFCTHAINMIREKYYANPIEIEYKEITRRDMIKQINNGSIDIGICSQPDFIKRQAMQSLNTNGIEFHSLAKAVPGIYVSSNSRIFPKDMEYAPYELMSEVTGIAVHASFSSAETGMLPYLVRMGYLSTMPRAVVSVGNAGIMRECVNIFDGYSIATYCREAYEKVGFYDDIRFLPFPDPAPYETEIGFIQRANTSRSMIVDDYVKILREIMTE